MEIVVGILRGESEGLGRVDVRRIELCIDLRRELGM